MEPVLSAVNVFVSYAREDTRWKDELVRLLKHFEAGGLKIWHDYFIGPGDWHEQVLNELRRSQIVVLLMSDSGIRSERCRDEWDEVRKMVEAYNVPEGSRQVQPNVPPKCERVIPIPVIVSHCDWEETLKKHIPGNLQVYPRDNRPLIEAEHRNELWLDVVDAILKAAEKLREERRSDFLSFFGRSSLTGKYPAVFSHAKAPPCTSDGQMRDFEFPHKPWEHWGFPPDYGTEQKESLLKGMQPRPKGIQQVIPFQELAPVLAIDRIFREFGGAIEIVIDDFSPEGMNPPAQGALSTGLGFNSLTVRLGKCSKLYEVIYEEHKAKYPKTEDRKANDDNLAQSLTDTFCILQRNETYLGGRILIEPREVLKNTDDQDKEYALLARVLIRTSHEDFTPYLVCSGHTADGTASACNFLAENWRQLWWTYREKLRNKHMAGILLHTPNQRVGNQTLRWTRVYWGELDPLVEEPPPQG